jgi:hypothetical protein
MSSPKSLPAMLLALVLSLAAATTDGQGASSQEHALDQIADFASRLCGSVPLRGHSSQTELSGSATLELQKLLRSLASAGVEGAAKYQSSQWSGPLQKDLARAMEDTNRCRLEVLKELKDRLLPEASATTLAPFLELGWVVAELVWMDEHPPSAATSAEWKGRRSSSTQKAVALADEAGVKVAISGVQFRTFPGLAYETNQQSQDIRAAIKRQRGEKAAAAYQLGVLLSSFHWSGISKELNRFILFNDEPGRSSIEGYVVQINSQAETLGLSTQLTEKLATEDNALKDQNWQIPSLALKVRDQMARALQ